MSRGLLIQPNPYPDEYPFGYLLRLAYENYMTPKRLEELVEQYELLGRRLWQAQGAFSFEESRRWFRFSRRRRTGPLLVCPHCLAGDSAPYVRAWWRVRVPIPFCYQHRCCLVQRVPETCAGHRFKSLVECDCGFDVRRAPAESLPQWCVSMLEAHDCFRWNRYPEDRFSSDPSRLLYESLLSLLSVPFAKCKELPKSHPRMIDFWKANFFGGEESETLRLLFEDWPTSFERIWFSYVRRRARFGTAPSVNYPPAARAAFPKIARIFDTTASELLSRTPTPLVGEPRTACRFMSFEEFEARTHYAIDGPVEYVFPIGAVCSLKGVPHVEREIGESIASLLTHTETIPMASVTVGLWPPIAGELVGHGFVRSVVDERVGLRVVSRDLAQFIRVHFSPKVMAEGPRRRSVDLNSALYIAGRHGLFAPVVTAIMNKEVSVVRTLETSDFPIYTRVLVFGLVKCLLKHVRFSLGRRAILRRPGHRSPREQRLLRTLRDRGIISFRE